MTLIDMFVEKAKRHPQTIVYPEGSDKRIVVAASKVAQMGMATPILLGAHSSIRELADSENVPLEGIQIIDINEEADRLETFANAYVTSRDVKLTIARKIGHSFGRYSLC